MIDSPLLRCSLVLLLVCVGIGGAAAQDKTPSKPKTLAERVEDIETRSTLAEWRLKDLDAVTGSITAKVDCDNGGFTYLTLRDSGLSFLVSCNKVEPYLEGFRVSLSIGNPYSMRFEGYTASLGYGETPVKALSQTASIVSVNALLPGSWNVVTVVINQITAKDVRNIYVKDLLIKQAQAAPR